MLPEFIETARLTLRPWRFEDAPQVFAYARDEEWSRYLPLPRPYIEADARKFIASQVLRDHEEHPSWAVEHEGQVVGGLNLPLSSDLRIGELGYSIARPLWGRGLATEAARAVVDAAFESDAQFARVRAAADARNLPSQRVLEKLGMTREGTLRANRFVHGVAVDEVWWGLLRREWESAV